MGHTSLEYTYWKDDDIWLGYLDEFPDYLTQGESVAELTENLRDIYKDLTAGHIPADYPWASCLRPTPWVRPF